MKYREVLWVRDTKNKKAEDQGRELKGEKVTEELWEKIIRLE